MIYLRADERVPFGAFASVMDAVKQAGITNVSIVTQPLDTKGDCGERREVESRMERLLGLKYPRSLNRDPGHPVSGVSAETIRSGG